MATLTVRSLDESVYDGLKSIAAETSKSLEATARGILADAVSHHERWAHAKAADLDGGPALWDIEIPYVRSRDLPRDVNW